MNPERVIKRSGEEEPFNPDKIVEAIKKAAEQAGEKNAEEIANEISKEVLGSLIEKQNVSTSEIKDLIIKKLNEKGYENVVKAWEDYEKRKEELQGE
jgi:transcriptional regulator NrdR family protein